MQLEPGCRLSRTGCQHKAFQATGITSKLHVVTCGVTLALAASASFPVCDLIHHRHAGPDMDKRPCRWSSIPQATFEGKEQLGPALWGHPAPPNHQPRGIQPCKPSAAWQLLISHLTIPSEETPSQLPLQRAYEEAGNWSSS